MARRILILFAHPAFQKSRVHSRLAAAVRNLPQVTFRDLYEEYPDFQIDVPQEQSLLREHKVVVFQHPFYWYSCPALIKEWLDLVLEYNFAYGPQGTALHGKQWLTALSAGGAEAAYRRSGQNYFSIGELLAPFQQTAALCGMKWLEPFVVHGALESSEELLEQRAHEYALILRTLAAGRDLPLGRPPSALSATSLDPAPTN